MDPDRALYATLGLTGFGAGNGPTRKRRVDEAFTELNANSFNPDASGSNSVPMGPRRKSSNSATPDDQPEPSGASSSAQHVGGPAGADATPTPLAATSANQDPASDAASAADPTAGMKASEARKYWKKMKKDQQAPASAGLADFLAYGQSLPVPPPPPARPTEIPKETSTLPADSTQPADYERTATGDVAYFLPSFIEDPWSRLLSSQS
ncbi:l d-transpeptidase catalytic cell wall binding repeat [Diplodia corticola]|uniref:L d-transpeptidase catalytic cell wall binding repeat n=1 Tax=Diplodia corticola TaxID=236234 RepID=A0A1J9RAI4_9PEZI|nr:l d-transpeptidase catalytic cell wall binding repeat [Diplodia corticola]OJD37178.1 l d-transpeptidase catalytic cell wall binding repeat [Diplodia corticola]